MPPTGLPGSIGPKIKTKANLLSHPTSRKEKYKPKPTVLDRFHPASTDQNRNQSQFSAPIHSFDLSSKDSHKQNKNMLRIISTTCTNHPLASKTFTDMIAIYT